MKEINAVTLGSQVYSAVQGSSSTANTLKGKQSFDSFLNIGSNASANGTKTGSAKTVQAAASPEGTVQAAASPEGTAQAADTVKADAAGQQADAGSTAQVSQENTDSSAGTAQTGTDMENPDVSKAGEITGPVNDAIKEAIKDITGLDDESLEEIMAVLSMSFTDLLDIGNLKQFVMYINNTSDVTDLLMDESMMSQLNNLADVIAAIDIEAITGMTESDFAQLLQNMAEGNVPVADNNSGGAVKEPGELQVTVDIPVTAEYAVEEDVQTEQKEAVQMIAVTKEDVNSQKGMAGQESETANDGRLQTGKETQETINTAGGQQSFKQGMEGQAESSLAEEVQAEAKPAVHEETFNGQAGFIQNLAQAAADVKDVAAPQQANMQTMIDIVNQVVEQIKVTLGKETTSMQLQLNPESLGKVLISVTSNHGVMTANFTVQTEEAKEALQSQMFSLREALESRNLKVDAVEVEVSDFAFSQSSQADAQNQKEFENGNGKRFRFGSGDSGDEEAEPDVLVSGKKDTQRLDMGSSIDFTA